jgi:translation initiation factor 2D
MEPSVTKQIPVGTAVIKAPTLTNERDFPALGSEPMKEIEKKVEKLEIQEEKKENETSSANNILTMSPDEVLKRTFLTALKLHKKELTSSLPILVGTFYPLYVQKQPQPSPYADKPITVKDTSFKKLSTFMKKMSDDGFIVVREETKGVDKIISINYDHPEIVSHVPLKPNDANATSSSTSNETSSPHLLLTKMTELYVVNESTQKLFNSLGVASGKALDKTQIKNYVKDYVSRNKLINTQTKDVTMDDVLVEICCCGERENDNAAPALKMSLDNIISIVISSMDNTYEMRSQAGAQMKGGKKPIIQISTAVRSGNKKVTLVNNLEAYGEFLLLNTTLYIFIDYYPYYFSRCEY